MSIRPTIRPDSGVLLIAAANLLDNNFARSVILLCAHDEDGSFGLVLNHELPVRLQDVSDEFAGMDVPVFRGGPVQPNTLHFIHRLGDAGVGGEPVLPGLHWGGSFDKLRELLLSGQAKTRDFRVFLGYSGWSGGQLEGELERDSWYLRKANKTLCFYADSGNHWRHTLGTMGADYAMLSLFPDHPTLN